MRKYPKFLRSAVFCFVLFCFCFCFLLFARRKQAGARNLPPPPPPPVHIFKVCMCVCVLCSAGVGDDAVCMRVCCARQVSETMPWSFSPLRAASCSAAGASREPSVSSLRGPATGSLGSLRAAGRLSGAGSSATLRAEQSSVTLSPPPAADSGMVSRSRFYVGLDGGGRAAGAGEPPPAPLTGHSRFYLPLSPESEEGGGARADVDSGCGSSERPPAVPALVVTDTSVGRPAEGRSLAPPSLVVQSRSCEPLGRPGAPAPPPAQRRLSRSSADLRAPVRFVVGDDEEPLEPPATEPGGRCRPAAGTSESSDDDSGLAGCERCAGPPPPAVGHAPLSRRHSDSIRDTSQYLRGYRSLRFSQPPAGWAARKARHVSDGGSPSPPPEPPPPSPPPTGRGLCRCLDDSPAACALRTQVREQSGTDCRCVPL